MAQAEDVDPKLDVEHPDHTEEAEAPPDQVSLPSNSASKHAMLELLEDLPKAGPEACCPQDLANLQYPLSLLRVHHLPANLRLEVPLLPLRPQSS